LTNRQAWPKNAARSARKLAAVARSCRSLSRDRLWPRSWIGRSRLTAAIWRLRRENSVAQRDQQPLRPFVRSGPPFPNTSLRFDTTGPCAAPSSGRRSRRSNQRTDAFIAIDIAGSAGKARIACNGLRIMSPLVRCGCPDDYLEIRSEIAARCAASSKFIGRC
jgi:hypothetical protein